MSSYNTRDQKVHILELLADFSKIAFLVYNEDQGIIKHNDSSDSLIDAVAATGKKNIVGLI